jgi:hypothetical protein
MHHAFYAERFVTKKLNPKICSNIRDCKSPLVPNDAYAALHRVRYNTAIPAQPHCSFIPATTNLGCYNCPKKFKSWHSADCSCNLILAAKG